MLCQTETDGHALARSGRIAPCRCLRRDQTMTCTVAVLGANGFIGCRTVELLQLSGWANVRPIVRRPDAFASLSRFAIDAMVADARDIQALTAAFAGCQYVVHAVAGDARTIVDAIEPVYRAATAAGVLRLIYLSSASVHGQSPPPGTDETSALHDDQTIEYNNAKVHAERRLGQLSRDGAVEVVVLRPGIVFGPRSSWTGGFADELIDGSAYLVDGGRGICNSAYVDNVIHAIKLAIEVPEASGRTYLIGDREEISWADLCRPIAEALGFDLATISASAPSSFAPSWKQRLKESEGYRRLVGSLPRPVRCGLKAGYAEWRKAGRNATGATMAPTVMVSQERALLHQCQTKLPWRKAEHELGYQPAVSFEEACRRSVGWLTFAGYPTWRNGAGR
ncbi:MAG: NAD-dependent epimerase/dehydratase family protein [Mesorhizobium sp.]|nr:MAG: NAD-dependent epimerase/dehydratase family protein [Mesorhizobium sp.]RWB93412.1 MAG: NAD-dependent epimerase/dehydratase family protein [Mesorhizobium sp.]RWK08249.1 MAG: NAD-dependent epimerase/dehydratase family protein [Mesorhizobium sp.]